MRSIEVSRNSKRTKTSVKYGSFRRNKQQRKKQQFQHHRSSDRQRISSKVIHVRIKSLNTIPTISKSKSSFEKEQKNISASATQTVQISDCKDIRSSGRCLTERKCPDKKHAIYDHHRASKKKKVKRHVSPHNIFHTKLIVDRCSRKQIIASLVISFLLMIIVVAAILIPVLIKSKQTNQNETPVLRWYPEGVTLAGVSNVSGKTANLLNYPSDVVVDWSYTLYVADRSNNRIQKFLRGNLNATTVAGRANAIGGSSLDAFIGPGFLLVDDDGNMHVSDIYNYRVMFWKKDATQGIMVAGNGTNGTSTSQMCYPHGLDYDRQSNTLFVADFCDHRVMKYLYNTSTGILVGGNNLPGTGQTQLSYPHGIFFDQSSNSLLIANAGVNNIVRWVLGDSQWSIVVGNSSGVPGNSSFLLAFPTDVMLDPMHNIYVVDRANHRIQFFPVDQLNAMTIAGINGKSGSNSISLNLPNALTLDNQLNLYVADWYNHRIQKFLRY